METTRREHLEPADLSHEESLDLLRSTSLGRVAVNGEKCPLVFPVRYGIDGGAVVFRTCPTVREALSNNVAVTFQADGTGDVDSGAWSVCAQGVVEEMRDLGRLETPIGFVSAESQPWARSNGSKWVRIVPQLLTGIRSSESVIDISRS